MSENPANQVAIAKTYHELRGAPKKTHRHYLTFAQEFMDELRDRGFRVVPFPPLKNGKPKKAKKRA